MKKVKEFHQNEPEMLQHSEVLHKMTSDELSAFSAFDSAFDVAFMDAWQAAINTARDHTADFTDRAILQQRSGEVENTLQAYIKCMDDVEYYAEKAFGEVDEDVLEVFAFDQRAKAMQSMPRLVMWGLVTNKFVVEYQSDLLTAGMPAQLLVDMSTTFQAFFDAEQAQEKYKRERRLSTLRRISKLNKVYDFNRKVRAAAQRVFRNDAIKKSMFALTK